MHAWLQENYSWRSGKNALWCMKHWQRQKWRHCLHRLCARVGVHKYAQLGVCVCVCVSACTASGVCWLGGLVVVWLVVNPKVLSCAYRSRDSSLPFCRLPGVNCKLCNFQQLTFVQSRSAKTHTTTTTTCWESLSQACLTAKCATTRVR